MKKKITIALAGNPNAGKSTVFNAITGARQHIANYPGVTVEKKYGSVDHKGYRIEVVDLPGTYSLTAYSLEELVARNFLINDRPDLVVDIVDASNLDRNLYLTIQLKEMGVPLLIGLNMVDIAKSRGIIIDHEQLSSLLGVPVVPMVARSNKGTDELLDKIVELVSNPREWQPAKISYGLDIDRAIDEIESIIKASNIVDEKYPARWLALKCLEGDEQVFASLEKDPDLSKKVRAITQRVIKHTLSTLEEDPEGVIADHRYGYLTGITKSTLKRQIQSRLNMSDKIDKVMTNRILGPILMVMILYGMYLFTFSASEAPIQWLDMFFSKLKVIICTVVPKGHLQSLIISGIVDGVGGVLGFVPIIMFMFFAIAIIEDSGYMARIAFMLDRVLRWFGLHGNSVISLIISGGISGGCAVPGIMATRTLRDPKERIATLLVIPFMNCGAKLPVYAVLIAAFFSENQTTMMFLLTIISWIFALFAAKLLRLTVLKGSQTPFVMELPPYRLPTLKGVCIHTWERTFQYIKKAGTIILGLSVLLWAMMTFPQLPANQIRAFEKQKNRINRMILHSPALKKYIKDSKDLKQIDRLYGTYVQAVTKKDEKLITKLKKSRFFPLLKAIYTTDGNKTDSPRGYNSDTTIPGPITGHVTDELSEAAHEYIRYKQMEEKIDAAQRQTALKYTVAGWLGQKLEFFTRPLGFDYRTDIALVGGFAAKEVILSTLGTAYSLSDSTVNQSKSLSKRLATDPSWTPLKAFTLIIFTMLYVPCIATLASIKKETSWNWVWFSICFNLTVAYTVSLIISQGGRIAGM